MLHASAEPEMAGASDGRFAFSQIFEYLKSGSYPESFDKNDKCGLRKRAAFCVVKDTTRIVSDNYSYLNLAISINLLRPREGVFGETGN